MPRILLVDDEPLIKAAFRKMIAGNDEQFDIVLTASNGQDALRLMEGCPVDIVITDLKMPQMDGIALIQALRERRFDGVILVLSNYADFELVREALVTGATDYMLKANLNKASLFAQLRKASETLAARARSTGEAELRHDQRAVLRAHSLRSFLLSGDAGADGSLASAYAAEPHCLCDVLFLPSAVGSARPPLVSDVESVLRAIFEDVPGTDIVIASDRELLVVYPLGPLSGKGPSRQNKHDQIIRQIGMYFNTQVLLLAPGPAQGLDALGACRHACVQAAPLAFYALPAMVLDPKSVVLGAVPDAFCADSLAVALSEHYASGHEAQIDALLDRVFSACREARTHPSALCALLLDTARRLHAYAPGQSAPPQYGHLAECANETQLRQAARAALLGILAHIVPPKFEHCKPAVRSVLLYMHIHFASRITLDDIAGAVNLDKSYLCRLFKRETGLNPFAYLNGLRMNAAARMIENGDHYVREIAGRVGIDDPFYFTRLFKKHFGVNPSEYRKA